MPSRSRKRTSSRNTKGKPSTAAWYRRAIWPARRRGRPFSPARLASAGADRSPAARRRACSSRAAGPPSTPPRPAARPCRRSSSCCGPSGTPTCSSRSATRATTPLTLEAVRALAGPTWLVTGAPGERDRAGRRRGRRRDARDRGELVPHGRATRARWRRSRRCAARTSPGCRTRWPPSSSAPSSRATTSASSSPAPGRDWPTAQEAVLKLREGAFVAAEAHHTEQLLHGHLAAIDESVRCFVLEGEGRAAERARDAVAALTELGCEVELVADAPPGRRHRPLPAPDDGAGRAARREPRPHPHRRRALEAGARRLQVTREPRARGWPAPSGHSSSSTE